jgi:hypothetical protein
MKLNKPFEIEADEFHFNGHNLVFPSIKTEEQVAETLTKYCSLRTMVREILGSGYKMEEILKYAKEYREDFGESENNVPEVFVQIFDQFGFNKVA